MNKAVNKVLLFCKIFATLFENLALGHVNNNNQRGIYPATICKCIFQMVQLILSDPYSDSTPGQKNSTTAPTAKRPAVEIDSPAAAAVGAVV